ncbi:MAG TPA: restriction endonuclease subunit S [bacterium]|nr:restriction endonuclease subunit S [bacterium]
MKWEKKKLGDTEYFEILGSGIDFFKEEKEYLSTSSIEGNKIVMSEGKITYQNRPSRANMQPVLNSAWFARMMNTVKVYSFTKENKEEIQKYILSTGFAGVLCNPQKVIPKYLEKIFLSDWFNKLKDAMASDKAIQKSLNNDDLKNIQIPIPPITIQQKIVKVLDMIQEGIEIDEKIIERTKELKKSLMTDLFKYGAPSFRKGRKLKNTEIGEIPDDWKVVKLGEVCEKIEYGLSKKGEKKGQVPILRMNNIGDGKITITDIQYVDLTPDEFKKFKLEKGDVIFNRTNSIDLVGKTALFNLDGDFIYASYLLRLKLFRNLLFPEFLNFYFNWDKIQNSLKKLASRGASQVNISATRLSTFPLPLPSLPEQKEIAEILNVVDEKIDIEKRKKTLYEEVFKSLLNKIISGEIDVEKMEL